MYIAARILQIAFFAGLAGCASVVVVSWISIFKDGLTEDTHRDLLDQANSVQKEKIRQNRPSEPGARQSNSIPFS